MTLEDIDFPVSYDWGSGHAIVFGRQLAARLSELHAEYGRPDCKASPVVLKDGRLMLVADILTTVEPGGYLYAMWEAADKSILLPAVEVLPLSDAIALLPQPQQP
jgi:hypothetical protein